MLRSMLCVVVALSAVCLFATPASAKGVSEESFIVRVSYTDLDLANETDAGQLLQRVDRAARRACRIQGFVGAAAIRASRACERDVADRAVAQLRNPLVTEQHVARGGRGPEAITIASR